MAIVIADIKMRLSVKTGAAGDSTAGTPAGSLGKYVSQTDIDAGTPLNNIFGNVTAAENLASTYKYRCIFFYNSHATLTWYTPLVYFVSQVTGGMHFWLAVDTTAASDHEAAGAQALSVADEYTAPVGLTFATADTLGTALSLGNLAAGQVKALWIECRPANSAALASDGGVLRRTGGTDA
jgi:hypothetical protein